MSPNCQDHWKQENSLGREICLLVCLVLALDSNIYVIKVAKLFVT